MTLCQIWHVSGGGYNYLFDSLEDNDIIELVEGFLTAKLRMIINCHILALGSVDVLPSVEGILVPNRIKYYRQKTKK